jgi:hypothetical protein
MDCFLHDGEDLGEVGGERGSVNRSSKKEIYIFFDKGKNSDILNTTYDAAYMNSGTPTSTPKKKPYRAADRTAGCIIAA